MYRNICNIMMDKGLVSLIDKKPLQTKERIQEKNEQRT